MEEKVIYWVNGYHSFYYHKARINEILSICKSEEFEHTLINILELYNVKKYIEDIDNITDLSESKRMSYKEQLPSLNKIIGKYFSTIELSYILTCMDKLRLSYVSDFWDMIEKYKKLSLIDEEDFREYLKNNPHHFITILSHKEVSSKFSNILYKHLLQQPKNMGEIISYLLEKKNGNHKVLYVLDAFTPEQLNVLFKEYINSESPHINRMSLIFISQNDPKIGLDDEVRLLAKRKEEELGQKMLETGVPFQYGFSISFGDFKSIEELVDNKDGKEIRYDSKWIRDNLDYPTLLNNFIYLFGYVDGQFRSTFPKKVYYKNSLADLFVVKGKKSYNTEAGYDMIRNVSTVQMQGYLSELQRNGVNIEDVIKWFFETYLKDEFGVEKFLYNTSSEGTTYLEKCRNLASEMESVLKQFRLYVKNGHIDWDLFSMSSEHIKYSTFQSMYEKKYIYAKSERIKRCMHILFNDTLMCYIDGERFEECECLYDVFRVNGFIQRTLFLKEFQQENLEKLESLGVVAEYDGNIQLNMGMTFILKNLFEKGVLCYHYCGRATDAVEKLIESGDVEIGSTLFSKPEQDYLDYMLNKATFSDGFDLKNKYGHGTAFGDEDIHFQNYLELLKIMVLIMIKINEEFLLKNLHS